MATKIVTKNSSTASAVPTASDLVQGELAVNVADKRLFTEDNGGSIVELGTNPSTLTVTGEITANGGIALGDNDKATFGAGDDLQIYHDGDSSYISHNTTGTDLVVEATSPGDDVIVRAADDLNFRVNGNENGIVVVGGGATTLYNSNAVKLATTATGIDVTGTATMDGLTVDGASDLNGNVTIGSSITTLLTGNDIEFQRAGNSYLSQTGGGALSIRTNDGVSNKVRMNLASNGDISFYEDTGTTPKLFWDASAESLGIGTSSPSGKTHSVAANNQVAVMAGGDVSDPLYPAFGFDGQIGSNGGRGAGMYLPSDGTLAWSTAGAERMRIDSSGSLLFNGNGVVSVQSNSSNFYLGGGSYSPSELHLESGALTAFKVNGSERMRIDSSGNLLVGTTDDVVGDTSGTGFSYQASSGYLALSRDTAFADASVMYLNRTGGDGQCLQLRKDGAAVGSIGTTGGDIYIGTGDANVRFDDGADQIYPVNSDGSHRDAAVGLGWSGGRFKDLYLSGTANVGGLQARATGNIEVGGYNGGTDYGLILSPADGSTWWHMYNDAGGHLAFGHSGTVGSAEKMRIDSSGNLLVGCSSAPTGSTGGSGFITESVGRKTLKIASTTTGGAGLAEFINPNGIVGSISTSGSATAFNTSSDQRLKENIADAPSASDDIDAIQVRSFDWKADGSHQKYGMIAQELLEVAPEAVSQGETEEEMMGVDYSKLVPMLIKEIQSLRNRVAQLEE